MEECIKQDFWEEVGTLIQGVTYSKKILIEGDLNGHVGKE